MGVLQEEAEWVWSRRRLSGCGPGGGWVGVVQEVAVWVWSGRWLSGCGPGGGWVGVVQAEGLVFLWIYILDVQFVCVCITIQTFMMCLVSLSARGRAY